MQLLCFCALNRHDELFPPVKNLLSSPHFAKRYNKRFGLRIALMTVSKTHAARRRWSVLVLRFPLIRCFLLCALYGVFLQRYTRFFRRFPQKHEKARKGSQKRTKAHIFPQFFDAFTQNIGIQYIMQIYAKTAHAGTASASLRWNTRIQFSVPSISEIRNPNSELKL